ncbi:hypothetical protein Tco_1452824 [Tanacetum coccineum]
MTHPSSSYQFAPTTHPSKAYQPAPTTPMVLEATTYLSYTEGFLLNDLLFLRKFHRISSQRDRATGAVIEGFKDVIHNMENEQNGESGGDNVGFNANFGSMANAVANAMTDDNNRKKAKSEQLKDVLNWTSRLAMYSMQLRYLPLIKTNLTYFLIFATSYECPMCISSQVFHQIVSLVLSWQNFCILEKFLPQ